MLFAENVLSKLFKDIAHKTFDFLLETTFNDNKIEVISNRGWQHKGQENQSSLLKLPIPY
jgi:hypothetical protein